MTGPEFVPPPPFAMPVSYEPFEFDADTTCTLELKDVDGRTVSVPLLGIPVVSMDSRAYGGHGYSITDVALPPGGFTLHNPDGNASSVAMQRTILKAEGYEVSWDTSYRLREPDGYANGRPYWH